MFWSYIPSIAPLVVFVVAAFIVAFVVWIRRRVPGVASAHRPSGIMLLVQDALFEGMRDGVIVLDNSNHVLRANPTAQRIIGATHATDKRILAGQAAQQLLAQWPELMVYLHSTSKEYNTVVRNTHDGEQRSYEVRITPLQTQALRCIGRLLVFHETTQQERTAEALRQRKQQLRSMVRQLRELGRHKSDGAVQLHRDLSTSLTNLRFYLNLLEREQPDNHVRYIEMLNRELNTLQQMLDGLQTVSAAEESQDGQASDGQPVKLNDVVDAALADYRVHAEAADVKMEYIESASSVHTLGNFEQLVRVVSHLVGNAILHTPRGGQVWVKLYHDADGAFLQVQDTGLSRDMGRHLHPGRSTPPRDRQHEVDHAHSALHANRSLACVAESIHRLGGRIEADCQSEQGSTLTVRLPRVQTAHLTGAHRFKPAS